MRFRVRGEVENESQGGAPRVEGRERARKDEGEGSERGGHFLE